MKLNKKKFFIAGTLIILAVIAALIFFRFYPVNKIWRIGSIRQKEAEDHAQVVSPAPNALFFDFEVDPKTGNTGGLYHGIAHSGQYSAKAFGKNSYSTAIGRTVQEAGPGNLTAVSMSAWIYIFPGKNEPDGSFVFSVNNSMGANYCWKGIHVSGSQAPRGKWFKISGYFDLADITLKPDSKMLIYFWNNSSTDILVDDYYIVFGSQPARKGDSALVDMTRGVSFIPRFNYPPFPYLFLNREEITGNSSVYLYRDGEESIGDIGPYDRIFAGHFFSMADNPDDLFVIDRNGHPSAYLYCISAGRFKKVSLSLPAGLSGFSDNDVVLCGSFLPGTGSQLLIISENGLQLASFDKIKKPCSKGPADVNMNILWNTKEPILFLSGEKPAFYCAADINGDDTEEILAVSGNGSFKVLRFDSSHGTSVTPESFQGSFPVDQWNRGLYDIKVTPGKFLPALSKDVLLTVFRDKKEGRCSYTILRYDQGRKSFISCLSEKHKGFGKTIGFDTLKPEDEFFTGRFGNDGILRVFRYNRDWRYDLKEIRFNDTTFQTLCNIDFQGFEKDHNPKYFEILRIVPGDYLSSGKTSFMIIGKNCKNRQQADKHCSEFEDLSDLPNALQFYSYPVKQY